MSDANQFANIDEAAESVDVASAEAAIVTDALPVEVELLPEIRIMQLEAELAAQRAKLDELALSAVEQQADLKNRLRAAEVRASAAEEKHGEASRESFKRGQKISAIEREISDSRAEVEKLNRINASTEMIATSHIAEAESLKAQLLAQIADNEKLRRVNDALEARLAEGAQGIEYDIIQDATKDDLRAAEMLGWSVKHMQFSESGTLRVVLRRSKPNQSRDRKPATSSRAIPTRPIVPPAPAHPAPTAQADRVDGSGDMVIVGLDDTPEPARATCIVRLRHRPSATSCNRSPAICKRISPPIPSPSIPARWPKSSASGTKERRRHERHSADHRPRHHPAAGDGHRYARCDDGDDFRSSRRDMGVRRPARRRAGEAISDPRITSPTSGCE